MTITRRGFLKSCLALAAAPAIVKAENIMRIWTPPQEIILPPTYFNGAVRMVQLEWHADSLMWELSSLYKRDGSDQWMRKSVFCAGEEQPMAIVGGDANTVLSFKDRETISTLESSTIDILPSHYQTHISGKIELSSQGLLIEPGNSIRIERPMIGKGSYHVPFTGECPLDPVPIEPPRAISGARRVRNTLAWQPINRSKK